MLKVLFDTEEPLPIDLKPVSTPNGRISKALRPRKDLNPEQENALRYGLAVKDMFCLHGPPGTGKSTTIGELVTLLARKKMKILIAAPSNAAVDVMLAKISSNCVENIGNRMSKWMSKYFEYLQNIEKAELHKNIKNN